MCTVPLPKVSIAMYVELKLSVASSGSLASRTFELGDRREPISFRKKGTAAEKNKCQTTPSLIMATLTKV
jgi:hypothetical protein